MSARRKIRMGMVGGGPGSMIGPIHRMAARLDGEIELVCGVFSSDMEKSRQTAEACYLDSTRTYSSYPQMIAEEAALPEGERMDFVAVVTPNHLHFPVAELALKNGFHVLSDKPATLNMEEAQRLDVVVRETGLCYGLTHTYAGYPMIKQARHMVAGGQLGAVRKILVEYPQGWLSGADVEENSKQAQWRLDPAQAGVSSCVGDIGSHAAHLSEYVCGDVITDISAELTSVVAGRQMDDDATVLMRFKQGARGVLVASQICAGEENTLKIRVYGDRGGLEWTHSDANTLLYKPLDKPVEVLRAGGAGLCDLAAANCRTPAGHPEGYLEAFANHYRNFAAQIRAHLESREPDAVALDVPNIVDALRGMRFIEGTVKASTGDSRWYTLPLIAGIE